jgi:hypothetical protein
MKNCCRYPIAAGWRLLAPYEIGPSLNKKSVSATQHISADPAASGSQRGASRLPPWPPHDFRALARGPAMAPEQTRPFQPRGTRC